MIVDSNKIDQIFVNQIYDKQRKQLITEFADVVEEPQRLPPHRGNLNHKVKLTGYQPR